MGLKNFEVKSEVMSKYYAEIIDHVLERSGDTNANCQHNSLKGKLISGINLTIVLSN